jgi:phage host-nuclease inhibitor protein Gam
LAKDKNMLVFRNWDEVNQAIKEIGDIERRISTIENDMNERINSIKAESERDSASLLDRKTKLEKNVQEFTESYSNEFITAKSKKLLYGTVGFRKTATITIRNIKAIIEACKQNKMLDCITVTEKLNKEELEKYDDASLLKIGAKRKVGDKFYYEVNTERIDS